MLKPWHHYTSSILVLMVLPLLPALLEAWFADGFNHKSITLLAAVYPVTLESSSKHFPFLLLTIIVSIIFSSAFGYIVATGSTPHGCVELSCGAIGGISIVHAVERFYMHVVEQQPFLSFLQ